jgi:hypothetical protein
MREMRAKRARQLKLKWSEERERLKQRGQLERIYVD